MLVGGQKYGFRKIGGQARKPCGFAHGFPGGSGGMPPQEMRLSEIESGAFSGTLHCIVEWEFTPM